MNQTKAELTENHHKFKKTIKRNLVQSKLRKPAHSPHSPKTSEYDQVSRKKMNYN